MLAVYESSNCYLKAGRRKYPVRAARLLRRESRPHGTEDALVRSETWLTPERLTATSRSARLAADVSIRLTPTNQ